MTWSSSWRRFSTSATGFSRASRRRSRPPPAPRGYHRRGVTSTRTWRVSLYAGVAAVVIAFVVLWLAPSGSFIFLPDPAEPADPVVSVPGEKPGHGDSGIYFLEVSIRKASLLERLFPSIHKGASIVPARVYNPEGLSGAERRRVGLGEMSVSQQIAITVALESLGYHVTQTGARVAAITSGYPADGVIRLGDVVVKARGRSVRTPADLTAAMKGTRPGDTVRLTVRRNGARRELEVGTRSDPHDPTRAVMGISVEPSPHFPIDVKIQTRNIGGPSAGLAFALDIVAELRGHLDHGRRIAVTGALAPDGQVLPIGGIKQKTFGAREADADVFLVPKSNATEARKWADGLPIVPVQTFDQAVTYLKTH
jgi:PDZ domain-containing protein